MIMTLGNFYAFIKNVHMLFLKDNWMIPEINKKNGNSEAKMKEFLVWLIKT